METTWSSIQIDNNNEDMYFTYSEEEKQENAIAKANSKLVFTPKFIPMYLDLLKQYTLTEALLIWFIDFYKSNNNDRMYFTNEQLAIILKCSSDTISRAISKLEKTWIIQTSRKVRAWWWQIRFITECNYDSTFSTSQTRQNLQARLVENLQTNNNNINNNKINIYSSNEEYNNNSTCSIEDNNKDVCSNNNINKELDILSSCSIKEERKKKDEIENRDEVFEKLWIWYCKQNTKKQSKKNKAKEYFDKLIKTNYDLNLLRYALPRYIESVNDKTFIVLLRTYLSDKLYLDYKTEFDNLNKQEEVKVKPKEELRDDDIKLKYKRTYDNN